MKIFITTILIYLISILLISNLLILVCIKIWPSQVLGDNNEYFMWNYIKGKSGVKHLENSNLIVGDSKALAAFNPTILKHNFINFSIGGSTSFEEYLVFKKFAEINTIDTLVVSFSALKMEGHDASFNERTLPFNLATEEELNNLQKVEKKFNITIDNKVPDGFYLYKRYLIEKHFPSCFRSTFNDAMAGIFINNGRNRTKELKKELDETGHCLFGQADSSSADAFECAKLKTTDSFHVNSVCLSYLDSIWLLCRAKNINVIFIVTPIKAASYQKVCNTIYYKGYNKFVDSLKFRYKGLTLLKKNTVLPNTYFGDANHVNQRGSDFFSKYLLNELYPNSSERN